MLTRGCGGCGGESWRPGTHEERYTLSSSLYRARSVGVPKLTTPMCTSLEKEFKHGTFEDWNQHTKRPLTATSSSTSVPAPPFHCQPWHVKGGGVLRKWDKAINVSCRRGGVCLPASEAAWQERASGYIQCSVCQLGCQLTDSLPLRHAGLLQRLHLGEVTIIFLLLVSEREKQRPGEDQASTGHFSMSFKENIQSKWNFRFLHYRT